MAWFRRRGFKRRRIIFRRKRYRRTRLFRRRFRRQLTRVGIGRPERKYGDTPIDPVAVPEFATSLAPVLLTGIAEGSDNNERIGRRVLLTNLQIRLLFTAQQETLTPLPYITMRLLIVRDSQFTGANVPTLGDILGTTVINSIWSFNDLQVQGTSRFRTLVDKIWVQYAASLNTPTSDFLVAGQINARFWKYYKKMRKELYFNGPTNVNTDAGRNAIWMFVFKQDPTAAIDTFVEGGVRIRFTDV
ncbi:capsid [uncultured virus]|uniref:Capsid n=1 Tax=uncultured virus TaxID=340016 RepID=A0A2K9LSF6_9VIRU|nr:capsid [uncultured virus]